MAIRRNQVDEAKLNRDAVLPFELRLKDFAMAMQDAAKSARRARNKDGNAPSEGHIEKLRQNWIYTLNE